MTGSKNSQVTFGIAGAIGRNAPAMLQRMLPAFRSTPNTVVVKWMGEDFSVVTYQHCEDAQLAPGTYEFSIPVMGNYQGVIFGRFSDSKDWLPDDQLKNWPENISSQFLRNYVTDKQKALMSLNGVYVGALWNKQQKQTLLIRDRLGIMPLYTSEIDSEIVFSSDLRVFPLASSEPLSLDEQAIAEFMHFLYVPAPRTIYASVQAVLPGHFLSKDEQKSRQERYYPPRFVPGKKINSPGKIKTAIADNLPGFESHLKTALADVLPERGRVALLLSGGKDSSALAVALSQALPPERILAFTVGFEQEAVDESRDAARVCEALNIPHQVYFPRSDEMVEGIFELAKLQDQPFADPASLPLYLGLKHLPDDVQVILDGSGTDFYFGFVKKIGWKYYYLRKQFEKMVPEVLRPAILNLMGLGPRSLRSLGSKWRQPIEEVFVNWNIWSASALAQLFGNKITFEDTYLWQFMRKNAAMAWQVLQTNVIFHIWEPNASYRKSFHLGQAMGRSVRFPFIDNRLAEFVNHLPQELQFDKYTNKMLLRAYLSKYLPQDVVQKPKGYFAFDLNTLLASQDHRWVKVLQEKKLLKALPFWSDQVIDQLILEYQNTPAPDVYYRLYALALISTWVATAEGRLN